MLLLFLTSFSDLSLSGVTPAKVNAAATVARTKNDDILFMISVVLVNQIIAVHGLFLFRPNIRIITINPFTN